MKVLIRENYEDEKRRLAVAEVIFAEQDEEDKCTIMLYQADGDRIDVHGIPDSLREDIIYQLYETGLADLSAYYAEICFNDE